MAECTVHDVKKNIQKFWWENYTRDFEHVQNDIGEFYWSCVISDILKNNQNDIKSKQIKSLSVRFFQSFLGCFFKAHELHHALLVKFECLLKLKRDQDRDAWQAWVDQLKCEKQDALTIILDVVGSNFESQRFIKPADPVQKYSVYIFDDRHDYLAQKVSSLVIPHIEHGIMPDRVDGTNQAAFPFSVAPEFISTLHQHGTIYTSRLILIHTIRQVDKHFLKNNVPISAYPKMSPSEAIDDLTGQFPEYKSLSVSQLTYLIQTKYRDQQGRPLKKNSIRKTLLRRGYSS